MQETKSVGELSHLSFAIKPLEYLSIDTTGGLGGYHSAKKYAHRSSNQICLDSYLKKSIDFVNLIYQVREYAFPKKVLADRCTGISSLLFNKYLGKHNINLILPTVYCPSSKGLVERVITTLTTVNRVWAPKEELG